MIRPVSREFFPEDLLAIKVSTIVALQHEDQDVIAWGKSHKVAGPCVTFVVEDHPVACGGFCLIWKGSAEIWLTVEENPSPGIVIAIRGQLEEWIKEYELDRVQALTQVGWEQGERFLQWLGFEFEGRLRKLGPNGIDQILYARVR